MVRTIIESIAAPIRRVAAPIRGLHQAAYLLAGLTLASQLLALLRDRLFAHHFGAGQTLDLYYAAFKVPDIVFALVASLVSAYVLIPRIAGEGKADAKRLISETTSFLLLGGGVLCAVLAVFAPFFLFQLFPAFKNLPEAASFVFLSRLLLVQPILLGLSGIFTSVTQVNRRFVLFALSPVLYNVGIIIGTVFLYPIYGLPGIGYGVIGGAIAHLLIHVPVLAQAKLLPRLVLPKAKTIWPVIKDSVPRSLALGMGSLSMLALTTLAARSGEGGISVFTLGANLASVPLALIGASYATAAFPVMAEHMGAKRFDEFKTTLVTAARHIIFWSAIASVLILVLRAHLVRIILGSGAFDWDATRLTAAILATLALALMAQGLVLLASRAFYAANRSWNPLLIQSAGAVVSVLGAGGMLMLASAYPQVRFFFESLFRIGDIPGAEIVLIAVGSSIGQLVMGVLALVTLGRVAPRVGRSLIRPMSEGMAAAIMGGAAAYGVLSFVGNLAPLTTLVTVFAEGFLAGMVGLIVAAAVLALLANQEFRDLVDSLRKLTSTKALKPYGSPIDNALND
ncbi:MAG: hypothetical protein JWN64_357 [Parcubacteria group bacterium]|nr:hypothetical protein [Parcubacteria group bacterium]